MGNLGNDLDLPFEEQQPTPWTPDENTLYSGGLVVVAACVDLPDVGRKPAIVFRFVNPVGEFYPPIVYVADDDQMAKLRPLINGAVAAARRAAVS